MRDLLLEELELMLLVSFLIIMASLIARFTGKKTGYRWRKILWLLIAVRLVIPINVVEDGWNSIVDINQVKNKQVFTNEIEIPIAIPQWEEFSYDSDNSKAIIEGESVSSTISEEESVSAEKAERKINMRNLTLENKMIAVGLVWGVVAATLILLQLLHYAAVQRRYRRSSVLCKKENILQMWENSCKCIHKKKTPQIMMNSEISSPMLLGCYNTVLLMPQIEYSKQELEMVMRHEAMHYQNRDLWYKLFLSFACCLHWFNPILFYMKKLAFQDIEYVCDEFVTREMTKEERYCYGQTLLKTMTYTWSPATAFSTRFAAGKRAAKSRLELLFSNQYRKAGLAIGAVLIICAIGIGTYISFGWKEEETYYIVEDTEYLAEYLLNADREEIAKEEEMYLPLSDFLRAEEIYAWFQGYHEIGQKRDSLSIEISDIIYQEVEQYDIQDLATLLSYIGIYLSENQMLNVCDSDLFMEKNHVLYVIGAHIGLYDYHDATKSYEVHIDENGKGATIGVNMELDTMDGVRAGKILYYMTLGEDGIWHTTEDFELPIKQLLDIG